MLQGEWLLRRRAPRLASQSTHCLFMVGRASDLGLVIIILSLSLLLSLSLSFQIVAFSFILLACRYPPYIAASCAV